MLLIKVLLHKTLLQVIKHNLLESRNAKRVAFPAYEEQRDSDLFIVCECSLRESKSEF